MKTKIETLLISTATDFQQEWTNQKRTFKRAFNAKLEQAAVALVTWLLSKRSVQEVIANTFSGSTPMCMVLDKAVENAVDEAVRNGSINVDVDDIDGLDRAIERAVESALEDSNFTDAVKDAIDLEDVAKSIDLSDLLEEHTDEIANAVGEVLARRLRGR